MPRIGSKRIAGRPRGNTAEKAIEEVPTTLSQLDTLEAKMQLHGNQSNSKRKRAASPSSDTDPLSLRGFQTPLASREKQEFLDESDSPNNIPNTKAVTKPPAKKMRAQSPEGSAEISPLHALEMALKTPTSASGTAGNPMEFESADDGEDVPMADRDDQAHEARVAPSSEGAVQEIKPAKTKKQLKTEQKQLKAERKAAEDARIEAKKKLKAERRAAAEAQIEAKKQRTAQEQQAKEAAAQAKQQAQASKRDRQIADMHRQIQTWPREKLVRYVTKGFRKLARRKLQETLDLELVKEGLKAGLKAAEQCQKEMNKAAAAEQDDGKARTAMDNWLNMEKAGEAAGSGTVKKTIAQVKRASKQGQKPAPGSKKARKEAVEQARQAEEARKNAPPPRPEDIDAEAKIIEKELEELSKKIKKEKADGGVKIKKEVIIKQEPRE